MKRITLLFCLCFGTATIAQVSVKDTVLRYTNMYENGSISLFTLDTTMSNFFSSLPSDDVTRHYEKVFKRSMYFWKDRTYVNSSGVEQPDLYTSSMIEYLETPNCPNGDEAAWEFHFDPSPSNSYDPEHPSYKHLAGIITTVYMNPSQQNIILAGSGASGIWYTENGGSTWENVTDHFRLPALGIQKIIDISKPSEPEGKFLIAATGKDKFHDAYGVGVLKSSDYGKTWTRHAIPEVGGKIQYLVGITKPAGNTDIIYAAGSENLFVSSDRGVTWSLLSGQPTLVYEKYYSIEASENNLIVTSVGEYGLPNGDVWKLNFGTNIWTNLTADVKETIENIELNNAAFENFETDFGSFGYSTILPPGFWSEVSPEIIPYGLDNAVQMEPIILMDDNLHTDQSSIIHNFEETIGTSISSNIIFDAIIPEGASIDIVISGEVVYKFLSAGEGMLPYEWPEENLNEYLIENEITIPHIGYIVFKASFDPEIYDIEAALPIIMDNVEIDCEVPITAEIVGIGVANMSDEIVYLQVSSYRSIGGLNQTGSSFLYSDDNGITTEEFTWVPQTLATRSVFTAGYDTENGLYFGNVQFNRLGDVDNAFTGISTKHDDVRSIQIVENVGGLNRIIVGDDGGVSFSEDNGTSWVSLNGDNFPITQFYGIGLNPNSNGSIIGGTQDNSTFIWLGEVWKNIGSGDGGSSGFLPTLEFPNRYFYQANEDILIRNVEGLGGALQTFDVVDNHMQWFLGQPIVTDPVNMDKLYSGHGRANGGLIGASFVRHTIGEEPFIYEFPEGTIEIGEIEVCVANTDRIYVAEGANTPDENVKKLWVSEDNGTTFTDISTVGIIREENEDIVIGATLASLLDYKNINSIETDPTNVERVWIGLSSLNLEDYALTPGRFRVLFSSDGGENWKDYSAGLPPFPINDLIYQNETNDRLFAATDVGVFYREEGMSEWVCFQEGMPATFATDLEINYCTQELFAGTYGRGIWKTPINLPDSEPVVITDDLTWGGTQTFDHDIIIESGNTLTLTGTLKMAGSKHIIVEPGARLKVDGGTLTSACGAFWGGVIVQGNSLLTQTPTNQGVVTLLNGALIENANVGVALWQPGDWSSTGGIIYSSGATFKDNKKDVEFIQYTSTSPNVSYFTNTTFTWTDDFMADNPLGHVTMYWVDGIRFTACDFVDERTSPVSRYQTDYGRNNSGIYSLDAHYYVLAGCSDLSGCTGAIDEDVDWRPCTFTNLDFGIYAANNVTENAITVDRAVFTNNLYGVQTVNVNGPAINRNQFIFTSVENNFEEYTSYGIHLIRSGGIQVEENDLVNTSATLEIVGIKASDLGETEELIYNNNITNMDWGIIAQGKNRSYDPSGEESPKGLQFQCNDNLANTRDHLALGILWDGPGSPYYGVKAVNGSSTNPSGNKFSAVSGAIVGEHYSNQTTNPISYFYYNGVTEEEPLDYLGDFTKISIDVVNNCATHLTEAPYISYSATGIAPYKTDFNTASASLTTKKAAYSSLLNGGNTSALLAAIASMTTSNASSMRTNLLNASPYLTDAVVRAALDKSNAIFPNSWGYELVMENIEVAYNSDFIDFLSTKTNPMPSWMIEDIEEAVAAGTSTDMLVKKSELAELEKVKSYAANQILHAFKNDTTGIEIDSLRNWVTQKNDLLVQTRIIDTYLNEGDYSTATTKLNVLESAISSYPTHVQAELTDYVSYKEKMVALLSTGSPLDSLSETDYSFVEDHANESEGIARYQAQELLCFFYGNCAEYALVIPQTSQSLAQIIPSEKTEIKRAFQVYPNPATDWVTIVMPELEGQVQMTITDLTGRVILVETITKNLFNWDTKSMSNGPYLITLINLTTGERIGDEKVVLQH